MSYSLSVIVVGAHARSLALARELYETIVT